MEYKDLPLLVRLVRMSWPYRWMNLLFVLSSLSVGLLTAYLLLQIAPFVKELATSFGHFAAMGAATDAVATPAPPIKGLYHLGFMLLALAPLAGLASYVSWWSGQWVANRTEKDLRDRLLGHLVRLDLSFHSDLNRGDLLTRLTTDLNQVLRVQQQVYGKILQRPFEALGILVAVGGHSLWLLGMLIIILTGVAMVLIPLVRRTRKRSKRARETQAANLGVLEQITSGIRVVKAMGSAEREALRYAEHNTGLFNDNMRLVRTRAQSDAISFTTVFAISGLAMVIGALLIDHHVIDTALLIFGIGTLSRLITSEREVVRTWGDVQEGMPSVERVFSLIDRTSRIVDRTGASACPPPRTAIMLHEVGFRYAAADANVLHKVSITIPIGKTVALVGPTGAGKTTLLDLIPRFHDVTSGRITIDGVDIRDLTLTSLAPLFAIVQQDNFLFDDSVYNNIAYGRPGATRAEIETAAHRAHVHDDILALEGGLGYLTLVGDRGGRLSGGQRQRIAIARALLRDAPILLLDEATSALDAQSERHVQAALVELMRNRTVVVIAHRLATIQHADLIYVFAGKDQVQDSSIIESGSHAELIAKNGAYANLVRLQQLSG